VKRNAVRFIYVSLKDTLAALEFMRLQALMAGIFSKLFDARKDSLL
jgi:hypothetical protein